MHWPVVVSHSRMVLSREPVATNCPGALLRSSFGLGCGSVMEGRLSERALRDGLREDEQAAP
jgi:hypothetical protein